MVTSIHQYAVVLGAIVALWMAALVTPGPDFLLISRISMTQGRIAAIRAAFGVATGIAAWGLAGFFGIHALFVASPWFYLGLKIGGGCYLMLLGVRLFAGSWKPAAPGGHDGSYNGGWGGGHCAGTPLARRPFHLGLLNNLANPKAPLFVSSLFAATLPPHPPDMLGLTVVGLMFALAFLWYVLVARLLTTRRVATAFPRLRRWIDRVAGIGFMGFGARLVLDRSA